MTRVCHYFAYGSNMNTARVAERGLATGRVQRAVLPGYALVFDKVSRAHPECAHANIVYAPGEVVEGLIYQLARTQEILKMDRFENAPVNYGREVVEVTAEVDGVGAPIAAWTYFANAHARKPGLLPPASYLAHLLKGEPYLSADYFAWLSNHAVYPDA